MSVRLVNITIALHTKDCHLTAVGALQWMNIMLLQATKRSVVNVKGSIFARPYRLRKSFCKQNSLMPGGNEMKCFKLQQILKRSNLYFHNAKVHYKNTL